jgi:hypothetical protein
MRMIGIQIWDNAATGRTHRLPDLGQRGDGDTSIAPADDPCAPGKKHGTVREGAGIR